MAEDGQLYYYILFETYTQGMLLQEYLKADGIKARIAPAPRSIQGELGCGMSLRFLPEDLEGVRSCIEKNHAEYYDIVPLKSQINPNRHKFC